MNFLSAVENRIAPLRQSLLEHPVYADIDSLSAVRVFMEWHVFAVWDFMSLLKALQRQLCCVDLPWQPRPDAQACRFINQIVLAEESDEDGRGGFASHFELYRRAMTQCGASTKLIDDLLASLQRGISLNQALTAPAIPAAARNFMQQTFEIATSDNLCTIASAFTFGREDLLPAVFQCIVDRLNESHAGQLDQFRFYLDRHIGLDGDEHGPLAEKLLESLCGSDPERWQQAADAAANSLLARKQLWDAIHEAIKGVKITIPGS